MSMVNAGVVRDMNTPHPQVTTQKAALLARLAAAERRHSEISEQVLQQEEINQQLVLAVEKVASRMILEQQASETLQAAHAEAQVQ